MIISASRRTDIPAFYSDWFMNRLKEGYVLVPNPRNPKHLGRVNLSPDSVNCIVFWTKNPLPMLDKLDTFSALGFPYYIQFSLTPYDNTIEANLPPKTELLQTFANMSEKISPLRSVWRYDPIIIDSAHSVSWHIEHFGEMCKKLHNYTNRCIFSFIDSYTGKKFDEVQQSDMHLIAAAFSKITKQHNITLYTCAEEINLSSYGIEHSSCIDKSLIQQIVDYPMKTKKDANQRKACHCIESIDIGVYNSCLHGCIYCYGTSSLALAAKQADHHHSDSPMLIGYPKGDETITDRTTTSQKSNQIHFML